MMTIFPLSGDAQKVYMRSDFSLNQSIVNDNIINTTYSSSNGKKTHTHTLIMYGIHTHGGSSYSPSKVLCAENPAPIQHEVSIVCTASHLRPMGLKVPGYQNPHLQHHCNVAILSVIPTFFSSGCKFSIISILTPRQPPTMMTVEFYGRTHLLRTKTIPSSKIRAHELVPITRSAPQSSSRLSCYCYYLQ